MTMTTSILLSQISQISQNWDNSNIYYVKREISKQFHFKVDAKGIQKELHSIQFDCVFTSGPNHFQIKKCQ